ncbi:recombination protein NinB [Paraburkholderia atlantica]|uniref:recombination protein NinB n=1 Tax=Paraburkholderia atlantica TaxID=2654982 RepID=UPI0016102219|nr:recombination protein NinB [Paraburkholderia atlantica]MBB5509603.1 anti-sigma factor RsiW [Paraburkholderia atlantica]
MKQYVLRDPEIARRMVDFIRATAGPANAAGRPLVVTVAEYKAKRSNEQNARYWALLTEIAESVQLNGKWFDRDTWHEWLKQKFAPQSEAPDGSLIPISTTRMNTEQFARYMTQIEVFATQELGVEFAAI